MPEPKTSSVDINGFSCRVWTAGSGPKLGFLAGFGGLPKWVPFLDALAKERTVIVPSLPGFPGGERGHAVLDSHLDWLLAVRQLLEGAGLAGADLAGRSACSTRTTRRPTRGRSARATSPACSAPIRPSGKR